MKSNQNIRAQPEKKKNPETEKREKIEIREKKNHQNIGEDGDQRKKSPEPRPHPTQAVTRAQAAHQWGELSLPLI